MGMDTLTHGYKKVGYEHVELDFLKLYIYIVYF